MNRNEEDGQGHEQDYNEQAPLLNQRRSPISSLPQHARSPSHVHFSSADLQEREAYKSQRLSKRRRIFLILAGTAILVVLIVLIIVGTVYGNRIRNNNGNKKPQDDDTPDYSKLPPPQPGLRNPSYLVRGMNGAVASETETCSQIGIDILKEGGKATDAAIASALCGELEMVPATTGPSNPSLKRATHTANSVFHCSC